VLLTAAESKGGMDCALAEDCRFAEMANHSIGIDIEPELTLPNSEALNSGPANAIGSLLGQQLLHLRPEELLKMLHKLGWIRNSQ